MKRIILFVFSLLFFSTVGAFARKFENESELYPKTLSISRIYNHAKGLRIDYIRQDYSIGTLWAPTAWFQGETRIATITYGRSAAYPYATFYYKDGGIDHFHLYFFDNPAHESWGLLNSNNDYSDKFPSDDSKPEISY